MKHFLRFRGCYCPKRIQPIYLIICTLFLLTGVGGKGAFAQNRLSGKVTDSLGNAIERATVHVRATNAKTATDARGFFEIAATPDAVLIVTALGYQRQEVPMMGQGSVAIILQPAANELEEVEINAGYYTTTRRTSTGNISRVTAEEIERQPVTNVLGTLIGRMPGVNVVQNSGINGSGLGIQIRGRNSLRSEGNEPLYIIDGVPFEPTSFSTATQVSFALFPSTNPLVALNPADISSIEVLKDADATAIYGSKGANGVVLITTKKDRADRTTVTFDAQAGLGRVANNVELLSTAEYVAMRKEAFANDGAVPSLADGYDLLLWDTTRYTDWQRELLGGTQQVTSFQGAVIGGDERTTFSARGGTQRQTTVFPGESRFLRNSTRFSVNHRPIGGKLSMEFGAGYVSESNTLPRNDLTADALELPPNAPALFDGDGAINWDSGRFDNPLAYTDATYGGHTRNLTSHGLVSYRILERLSFRSRFGYNRLAFGELQMVPSDALPPTEANRDHVSRFSENAATSWIVEPQLDFGMDGLGGRISMLAGGTFQEDRKSLDAISATGFLNKALMVNKGAAETLESMLSASYHYRYAAAYGRVHYARADRYFLNLTGRRDGSSRFGPGKRFANFAAVGVAWLFSRERFIEANMPWISLGKLRMSYGTNGSDKIGDYGHLDTYSVTTGNPYLSMGLYPTRLANAEYAWESSRKLEMALEMGMWRDQVNLSVSWYRNTSSSQLVGLPLPLITGFPTIQFNLPATVENTGLEASLQTINIESNRFSWTTSINATFPRNRLLSYPDLEASPYARSYKVGHPLSMGYRYAATGVDPQTGMYRIEDVDGDGTISAAADAVHVVNRGRTAFAGMENRLSFGDFSLGFLWQYVRQSGSEIWNAIPGSIGNQHVAVLDRWREPGDATRFRRYSTVQAADFSRWLQSTQHNVDLSFFRLGNATLNWKMPQRWTFGGHVRDLSVYMLGQNLWVVTGYKGLDPETGNSTLPPLRTIVFGCRITL